jgi:hypothetical protein
VPLYFGLLLKELTADKANFHTALQTGFSFLWAGVQWLWPFFKIRSPGAQELQLVAMLPVSLLVTFFVIVLGVMAPSTVQLATGSSGLAEASTVKFPPGVFVNGNALLTGLAIFARTAGDR